MSTFTRIVGDSVSEDLTGKKYRLVYQVRGREGEYGAVMAYRELLKTVKIGDTHPLDSGAQCVSIGEPQRESDSDYKTYRIVVEYATNSEDVVSDPTDEPAVIQWSHRKYSQVAEKGYLNGTGSLTAITNSAGDPFDPPLTIEVATMVCTIERNVSSSGYDPETAALWINKVNDADTTIAGATVKEGNAKINAYTASNFWKDKIEYWREHIEIEIYMAKAEGGGSAQATNCWYRTILDQGYRYLDGSDLKPCRTSDGKDVTKPVLLDGSGGQLSVGGTPVYRSYQIYTKVDFTPLNIANP